MRDKDELRKERDDLKAERELIGAQVHELYARVDKGEEPSAVLQAMKTGFGATLGVVGALALGDMALGGIEAVVGDDGGLDILAPLLSDGGCGRVSAPRRRGRKR
jgi:hypothetical protein